MSKIKVLFCLTIWLVACKDESQSYAIIVGKDSIIDYTENKPLEDSNSKVAYFEPLYGRSHIASDSMNVTIRKRKYTQTINIVNTREIINGTGETSELEMKVVNPFFEKVFYFIVPSGYEKVENGLNIRKDSLTGIFYIGCYDRAYPQHPKQYFYSLYEVFINEQWASDGVVEVRCVPKRIRLSERDLASINLR